jgi:hypothetical protein
LITCILCLVGIASIIIYWIFIPELAMYLTLFEIPFIGFFILVGRKGWIGGGCGGSGGDGGCGGGG